MNPFRLDCRQLQLSRPGFGPNFYWRLDLWQDNIRRAFVIGACGSLSSRKRSYETQRGVTRSVAETVGVVAETVRKRIRRSEIDACVRSGVSNGDPAEILKLERKVAELKRANEILRTASAFFRGEARPSPLWMTRDANANWGPVGVRVDVPSFRNNCGWVDDEPRLSGSEKASGPKSCCS